MAKLRWVRAGPFRRKKVRVRVRVRVVEFRFYRAAATVSCRRSTAAGLREQPEATSSSPSSLRRLRRLRRGSGSPSTPAASATSPPYRRRPVDLLPVDTMTSQRGRPRRSPPTRCMKHTPHHGSHRPQTPPPVLPPAGWLLQAHVILLSLYTHGHHLQA